MFYDILLVIFLGSLIFVTAYLLKKLFPNDATEADLSEKSIRSHGVDQLADRDFDAAASAYEAPQPVHRRKTGSPLGNIFFLLLLIFCGWYFYENRDGLRSYLPSQTAVTQNPATRISITPAQVDGHTVVDGINWIRIVATGTNGVPFEGWVSEMAIQSQPPKENKMADEMMKKLGLPTVRERAESLKKLQKVGKALDTALHQDMSQKEN